MVSGGPTTPIRTPQQLRHNQKRVAARRHLAQLPRREALPQRTLTTVPTLLREVCRLRDKSHSQRHPQPHQQHRRQVAYRSKRLRRLEAPLNLARQLKAHQHKPFLEAGRLKEVPLEGFLLVPSLA